MTRKEHINESLKTWDSDRSKDNMGALLRSMDPIIDSVAATYGAGRDANLKWKLRIHLANDIKNRYDPKKASITTFVYQSLQRTPRIIAAQKNVVHMPESSSHDMKQLRIAREDLFDRDEREPGLAEVADRAGVSMKRAESLDTKFGRASVPLSLFHSESGGLDPLLHEATLSTTAAEAAYRDYIIGSLDERDSTIYKYLSNPDPLAKSEIASMLGISAPALSKRVKKIESKLDFDS